MDALIFMVYLEVSFRLIRYMQTGFVYPTHFGPISELFQIYLYVEESLTISYTESVFPRYFGILDGIRLNNPRGCIYGNPLV